MEKPSVKMATTIEETTALFILEPHGGEAVPE
jgi:hypothetical protein